MIDYEDKLKNAKSVTEVCDIISDMTFDLMASDYIENEEYEKAAEVKRLLASFD